ncbi:MAG: NifU family protein [Patescibacteria group bacterium]|nr:NifU family protein [Patescibacteria group bacterium]
MDEKQLEIEGKIKAVLDKLREGVKMHGGDIEFVGFDAAQGRVTVRLRGACVGCAYAGETLKEGVEETLREFIPEVTEVVNID